MDFGQCGREHLERVSQEGLWTEYSLKQDYLERQALQVMVAL
jgi:hypothetical protein